MAHTVISNGEIDEEDNTPLSVLLGKMNKRKMTLTHGVSVDNCPIEDPMDVEVKGTETLHDIEVHGTETLHDIEM